MILWMPLIGQVDARTSFGTLAGWSLRRWHLPTSHSSPCETSCHFKFMLSEFLTSEYSCPAGCWRLRMPAPALGEAVWSPISAAPLMQTQLQLLLGTDITASFVLVALLGGHAVCARMSTNVCVSPVSCSFAPLGTQCVYLCVICLCLCVFVGSKCLIVDSCVVCVGIC